MKIFETHAHYDDAAFDEDREELLKEVFNSNVEYVVDVACSMETSRHITRFVKEYDNLYGTVGVHPDDVSSMSDNDIEELKTLACMDKILAIGEIGLDYHYDDIDKDLQKKWFEAQLKLSKELDLPIVIHSRDAAKDTLDIMKSEAGMGTRGVMHCFGYGPEMAEEYLKLGYYIGIGGVVTFKNGKKMKEVAEMTPLDRILLETDCPYLSPEPNRGKRNSSLNLIYIAREIARIKGISEEEVISVTFENAMKMYNLQEI